MGNMLGDQDVVDGTAQELNTQGGEIVEASSFFDYDEDYFFTREELNEFGFDIVDQLNDNLRRAYENDMLDILEVVDLSDIYMEDPSTIYIEVTDNDGFVFSYTFRVDFRKIRAPRDLYKYSAQVVPNLIDQIHSALFD